MLKHYRENVRLWWEGIGKLDQIGYKKGWNAMWFLPMYLLNYGTHVVLWGGAVVSWSRFSYASRHKYKMARLVNAVLDFFDRDHGANAGPALWDTTPAPSSEARVVRAFWAAITVLAVVWWKGLL